eukprot:g65742.t1
MSGFSSTTGLSSRGTRKWRHRREKFPPLLPASPPVGARRPLRKSTEDKRFIFAACNVDTDGDGVANEIQYQLMGFFGFNLKHSCMLDKSPLNFEKDVKPAFLPWVGNPTHPPLLGVWRKKELLLLLEANKRKRTGSGPEPRSSGRPKKLKFDTLKAEEDAEEDAEVAEQDDPPTSSSKGKKKSTSKGQGKGKKPSKVEQTEHPTPAAANYTM